MNKRKTKITLGYTPKYSIFGHILCSLTLHNDEVYRVNDVAMLICSRCWYVRE